MKIFLLFFLLLFCSTTLFSQTFVPNYDESKIAPYKLPDPLVFNSGVAVKSKFDWKNRRAEIYALLEREMYGKIPGGKVQSSASVVSTDSNSCNGLAIRKEIRLVLSTGQNEIPLHLLLFLPKSVKKPPVFLGYNFGGNHTVSAEPGILVASSWVRNNPGAGITDNHAREASRGRDTAAWQVTKIIRRGYGVVTLYYGDVDPDFDDGFKNGVHSLFPAARDSSSWGSIAAWSWGLSRVMDYLEGSREADPKRVMVIGHSRLGKAALWAGASDPRFAVVISNESGCGGAALSMRKYGETVTRTNTSFPHWFCANFKKYNNREETLPFDQHELLALVAPRPLYVSTATEDQWGDPKGSFLACIAASPVYQLLGKEGFPGVEMPVPELPVVGTIGYHIRTGKHDVKPYDWKCFMDFADLHFKK